MLSITKLQNLKAIHNMAFSSSWEPEVVVNHKTTKFESNSQQCFCILLWRQSCCQSQNYKIWKQFTTCSYKTTGILPLLSITKLQNLKAIHNGLYINDFKDNVVVNHKTTKFESNSQLNFIKLKNYKRCCQSQNYKIWKQFTTNPKDVPGKLMVVVNHKTTKFESNSQHSFFAAAISLQLLSITKLQNLKAIHNTINNLD